MVHIVDKWVIVHDAELGLILKMHISENHIDSKYTIESFDTEGEADTRISELGYVEPEIKDYNTVPQPGS